MKNLKDSKRKQHILCFGYFLLAVAVIVLRRPDVILNPQFWAEDGAIFYADAYNYGIKSILFPYNGFLYTFQRLAGLSACLFPLSMGPLVFNIIAIFVQTLPAMIIASHRFAALIPNTWMRLLLGLLYLSLPQMTEIHGVVTNSHWHLASLAFMVFVVGTPWSVPWRIFDFAVVSALALSGPFSLLLLPVVTAFLLAKKRNIVSLLVIVMFCGAAIQALVMNFFNGRHVLSEGLNATPLLFAKILAHQVFAGALVGPVGFEFGWAWVNVMMALSICCAGMAVFIFAAVKGSLELRSYIVFAGLIFFAAIFSPTAPWSVLWRPNMAGRYWFIPICAFVFSLLWISAQKKYALPRVLSLTALCIMCFGVIREWRHPEFRDFEYTKHVRRFERLPKGTETWIPINPDRWAMKLYRR